MVLNYAQIEQIMATLDKVLKEQEDILADAQKVICFDLAACWQSQAQRAYSDAFIALKTRVLEQINRLIELFGMALKQSQEGLYQVDIDIANMNSTALTG